MPSFVRRFSARLGGLLLGVLLAGLYGAIIGVTAGWWLDDRRYFAPLRPRQWRYWSADPGEQVFLATLFGWAGHIAKLDGRISEAEINAARRVMVELGLNEHARRIAIAQFNAGKQPGFPHRRMLWRLRRLRRDGAHRRWLRLLLSVTVANGKPVPIVERRLMAVARYLDIAEIDYRRLRSAALRGAGRTEAKCHEGSVWAFSVLGVHADIDHAGARLAYRRLISRHHPDRLQARGATVNEETLRAAAGRTREARAAYETLCRERGWRR